LEQKETGKTEFEIDFSRLVVPNGNSSNFLAEVRSILSLEMTPFNYSNNLLFYPLKAIGPEKQTVIFDLSGL